MSASDANSPNGDRREQSPSKTGSPSRDSDVVKITNDGQRPKVFKSTVQEVLFVISATAMIMQASMIIGSVTVISSFIGRDLHMTNAEITWLNSSSSLASGSLLLFFGKVADFFGRRIQFVGSMFFYAVFCLAAGFSQSPITLDILNGVIGVASAAGVPSAVGALGAAYDVPSKRKNHAFACFSAGNPIGFILGTLFSGVATQLFDWRASYFLLAIIYLVFTVIAYFTVPEGDVLKKSWSFDTFKKFDLIGALLTISSIGLFSSALSLSGDAPDGFKTPYVIVLLVLGVVLGIAFVFWINWYKYPLIPTFIWKDRNFTLLLIILMLGFMAFTSATFFTSLFIQRLWHDSPIMTAVHLLPMAIVGTLVNVFAGLFLHKISNKLLMKIGVLAYLIAFLLLGLNKFGDSYWAFTFPALFICVIGADLEFNVSNMYVMSALPKEQQSVAGGIFQTCTRLCTTIGFGISTALFDKIKQSPPTSGYHANDPLAPYSAVFWFAAASVGLSMIFVPFVNIGTQGQVDAEFEENLSDPNLQDEEKGTATIQKEDD